MSSRAPRAALVILFFLSCLVGCKRGPEDTPTVTANNYFKTHAQDESQFIVESIVADLAEMAIYSKSNSATTNVIIEAFEAPDSKFRSPSYDVKVFLANKKIAQKQLQLSETIWSPKTYEEIAKAVSIQSGKTTVAKQDPNDLSVIEALTDLQVTTIETENERISALLEKNFDDPTLHQMAAVILGAFALREQSGHFYDVRSPLCRMTAHLTYARALRGKLTSSANENVAEALLLTLMNNQQAALSKLETFGSEPKLAPWKRALFTRNTYDYRDLEKVKDRTLLEDIVFCQAIAASVSSDAGWSKISREVTKKYSDFGCIGFDRVNSVQLGHELHEVSLRLIHGEIKKVYSLETGTELRDAEMVDFLNELPERCITATAEKPALRVISSGQWGMFFQRHLCHVIERDIRFVDYSLGLHEEAQTFVEQMKANFGRLRLYPFVERIVCKNEEQYHKTVDEGRLVTINTPHLVGAGIWNYISSAPRFATRYWPGDHPHINEWFKHNPPPGTAYDALDRVYHPSLMGRSDTQSIIEQLNNLSPYDPWIANKLADTKTNKSDFFAEIEKVYRPTLEYNIHQIRRLANFVAQDPSRYEPLMLRYSKISYDGYVTLGWYFANRHEDDKALKYYEQGFKLCEDEVLVANNANWLVNYYFLQHELDKAEKLAQRAAEAYSADGLRAMANLMENEEKYDEALKYFFALEERYDQPGAVAGFAVRYRAKTGSTKFDKEISKRFKTLFPRGLERVNLGSFQGAPDEAVLIAEENDLVKAAKLKKGDLIVALDGLRVYDLTQYLYVRSLTNSPVLQLIVWDGNAYSEKKANPPKHRFEAQFLDYYEPRKK